MVCLLTGTTRGLCRAIAEAALNAGHSVVATARHTEPVDDQVSAHPDRVAAVALDVTDYAAAGDALKLAVERFGRLDVVVSNAGYADLASVEAVA